MLIYIDVLSSPRPCVVSVALRRSTLIMSFVNTACVPPSVGEVNYSYKEEENEVSTELSSISPVTNYTKESEVSNGQAHEEVPKDISVDIISDHDDPTQHKLLYKASETPPFHLLLFFGFQQALVSISGSLVQVIIAAGVICADKDEEFKAQMLGSTLFTNGVSTLLMVCVGARLPLYQGSYGGYLIPLLTLQGLEPNRCKFTVANVTATNSTDTVSQVISQRQKDFALKSFQEMQGSLMLVGALHALIGGTGLIGVLLRFIGPVTVVPTILLLGIYIVEPTLKFAVASWPITFLTIAVSVTLAFYLAKYFMPIPVWTPSRGCRIVRYPLHQVYAILISIIVGWVVCYIVTKAGGFTDDPNNKQYLARSDAKISKALDSADWLFFPYPGLHGMPSFKVTVFAGYIIATIISILDSIGDYYACAAMSHVPPPPRHALNRGIFMEGISTIVSGAIGAPVGTTTYGPNIGAIGITRVASRSVFVVVAIIYLLFGVLGKLSAIFISIPYPVLGGAIIMMVGMFIGVNLSNLKPVDLSSTRNLAIIGVSVMIGLIIPLWVKKYPEDLDTGDENINFLLKGLLGNPNVSGGICACFLDNTIPGTKKERGIAAWQDPSSCTPENVIYEDTIEIYDPPLPRKLKSWRGWKYVPFMPNPTDCR